MVIRIRELVSFVEKSGIEDEVNALPDEPCHMSVRQFCGITFRFTGNRFNTELVNFAVGAWRKNNAISERGKKGEPERIVFIHIQDSRNAYRSPFGFVHRERFIGKESF